MCLMPNAVLPTFFLLYPNMYYYYPNKQYNKKSEVNVLLHVHIYRQKAWPHEAKVSLGLMHEDGASSAKTACTMASHASLLL